MQSDEEFGNEMFGTWRLQAFELLAPHETFGTVQCHCCRSAQLGREGLVEQEVITDDSGRRNGAEFSKRRFWSG